MLTIGSLTGKKPVWLLVPGAVVAAMTVAMAMLVRAKRRWLVMGLASAALAVGVAAILVTSARGVDWTWLPHAIDELFSEFFDAAPIVVVAAPIGLATLLARRIHPPLVPGSDVPSARAGGGFPIVCLQLSLWAVLLALYRTSGYISHRHFMLSVAPLAPLASVGVVAAAGILVLTARRLGRPIPMRAAMGVIMTVATAAVFFHTCRPLHDKQRPSRQAGEQLALLVSAGDVVLVNSPYIAYYGNVPTRQLPDEGRLSEAGLLRLLTAYADVRFLALSRADSAGLRPGLADGRLHEQQVCRLREDRDSGADVIIYAVTPASLSGESP